MAAVTEQKHSLFATRAETAVEPQSEVNSAVSAKKASRFGWWLLALVIIVALGAAAWFWRADIQKILRLMSDQETVSAYLQSFGLLGPLVLAIAQMLQVLIAFIPGHVFLIAAGYVYGFPLGLLMNITFTVVASQICFLLARWAGQPVVNRLVDPQTVIQWSKIADQKGILFFTLAFLLPVFPSDAMNFVGGLSGLSSRKFLVASFMGRLPSAIMLTLIGSHGLEFSNTGWAAITAVAVLLFLVGRYVMGNIQKQAIKQSTTRSQPISLNAPTD